MEKPNRVKRGAGYLWREWLKPTAIIAAVVLPIKSAIADWNFVPSGSMKPTILEGDLVLVNKLAYDLKVPFTLHRLLKWDAPQRGDIVVFFSPTDGVRMVKRVVAVPGDKIAMRNNVLIVNGQGLAYEPVSGAIPSEVAPEDSRAVLARERDGTESRVIMSFPRRRSVRSFDEVTVPPGKFFVMGDSRDNSIDSRFFGFVDGKQIVGRSSNVVLSFDKNNSFTPRGSRFFSSLE